MNSNVMQNYRQLIKNLSSYPQVAVAYSGGVDSTVLVYGACEAIGPANVLVLHATSCLLSADVSKNAERVIEETFDPLLRFKKIAVNPMAHDIFIKNDPSRCYYCKHMIYTSLIEEMEKEGIAVLIDGTNCDDLQDHRPGLRALKELGVKTPFVESNITKSEIRIIAASVGLSNAELPSNSCLATRIAQNQKIDHATLTDIETMEHFLRQRDFLGCRVRPRQGFVILEIQEPDFLKITDRNERIKIRNYFQKHGFDKVLLDIIGRL
jgi:uncharacterized protein